MVVEFVNLKQEDIIVPQYEESSTYQQGFTKNMLFGKTNKATKYLMGLPNKKKL